MKFLGGEDFKPHGKPMKQVTYKLGPLPVIIGVITPIKRPKING